MTPRVLTSFASPSLFAVAVPVLLAGLLTNAPSEDEAGDILVLKDGRIIDGFEMEQGDGHVIVELKAGNIEIQDNLVDVLLEKDKELSLIHISEPTRPY